MSWRLFAFSFAFLALAASRAFAHASLLEASPEPGSVVSANAVTIELRFDSRLDPRFSRLTLVRPDGDEAALALETGDARSVLKARATDLGEGNYVLHWRVLGVDGHANQGDIKFRVGR